MLVRTISRSVWSLETILTMCFHLSRQGGLKCASTNLASAHLCFHPLGLLLLSCKCSYHCPSRGPHRSDPQRVPHLCMSHSKTRRSHLIHLRSGIVRAAPHLPYTADAMESSFPDTPSIREDREMETFTLALGSWSSSEHRVLLCWTSAYLRKPTLPEQHKRCVIKIVTWRNQTCCFMHLWRNWVSFKHRLACGLSPVSLSE